MKSAPARKRGNPSSLTPEAEADLEALWCKSTMPVPQIADLLSERYGYRINAGNIARGRGWHRDALMETHPESRMTRLQLANLERWAAPKGDADNTVHKQPTRYRTTGGFSMIGGRVA